MPLPLPLDLLNANTPPVQDFIVLNGVRSPGRATIVNAGSPRNWDKQKGWGTTGATLIYTGDDLAEFDVVIDLWLPEHWAQWNTFARVLEKRSTGLGAKFLSISHPLLYRAPLRITQVALKNVSQFELAKSGMWTCRLSFIDWKEPMPALGKPNGTIPRDNSGIADFASDPQIAALMAKQAALGGAL